MTTLQNFLTWFYALKNNKGKIIGIVAAALIILGFYQYAGVKGDSLRMLKGSIFSAFQESILSEKDAATSELSTGGAEANKEMPADTSWAIRKSIKGETIWQVSAEIVKNNNDVIAKNQAINGLKNLTIIKNKIAAEKISHNSLSTGSEYSFPTHQAAGNFIKKLNEADKQMQGGTKLSDLSTDLRTVYLVANAPSYQFLNSLPADNINALFN